MLGKKTNILYFKILCLVFLFSKIALHLIKSIQTIFALIRNNIKYKDRLVLYAFFHLILSYFVLIKAVVTVNLVSVALNESVQTRKDASRASFLL